MTNQVQTEFSSPKNILNDENKLYKREIGNTPNNYPQTYAACVAGASTINNFKDEKQCSEKLNHDENINNDSKTEYFIKNNVSCLSLKFLSLLS